MSLDVGNIIAALALLLALGKIASDIARRLAKGSFVTHAELRALELTMNTTHINHSQRIKDVEHGNRILEERMSHFPDRDQFDAIRDQIAELRTETATVTTRLEEMPRIREAVEELSRELREGRRHDRT